MKSDKTNLLNKRSEFFAKCRHREKFSAGKFERTGKFERCSIGDLLESPGWKHLELRRNYLKSVFMYKILNNHTAPNLRKSFLLNDECDNSYMILEIEKPICLFRNRIPILVKDASNITER